MASPKAAINSVRGTQDIAPADFEKRRYVWQKMENVFRRFGYDGVEVPTLEYIDLHLRKSGEKIRRHMYNFKDFGNDTLCLRPEFTASVVRLFNSKLTSEKLPQKLYYHGSTFRYDKPQKGRYREFTQAGMELIGGATPEYDAECIALSIQATEALGLLDYEVVIGHIGILLEILQQKKIDDRVASYLIESLEILSKAENIEAGIAEIEEGLNAIGVSLDELPEDQQSLVQSVKNLPQEEVQKVVSWVVDTIYGEGVHACDSDTIAQNMLAKLHREEQRSLVRDTLMFIRKLVDIKGKPEEVFPKVDALLAEYNLDPKPLDELKAIAKYLNHYGVDWNKVSIDFGFGRGLAYYTGMIFEMYVYSDNLGVEQKQVLGGGRYDSLVQDLGNPNPIPACGFSFGVERMILAMEDYEAKSKLNAFIVVRGDDTEFCYGLDVLDQMRKADISTDIGEKGKSVKAQMKMADSKNVGFVVIVAEDEMAKKEVSVKNMQTSEQSQLSIPAMIDLIKGVA